MLRSKRGQMMLWIVLAVFLVGAIFLFAYTGNKIHTNNPEIAHPGSAIEGCVRDAIDEMTKKMMPQGGFAEPKHYKLYKNTKVEYLCDNLGFFAPCVQQHPLFLEEMRGILENYVKEKTDECFRTLKKRYEQRATNVELGEQALSLSWGVGKIKVNITRMMKLSKGGKILTVDEFPVEMNHPLYVLGSVAVEIANQEARYCHFDSLGYSILSPEVNIKQAVMSDETSIYQIQDTASKKELWIAIRSCVVPSVLGSTGGAS